MRAPPPGGEFAFMQAEDGASIRYAFWPGQEGKPTIVFLPGFRETIEKHFETIDDLLKRGLSVFTLDWRGQGLSDRLASNRKLGHIDQFVDYQNDIDAMMGVLKAQGLPQPYYLCAHSMGGTIGLRALHNGLKVKRAVFSAPLWGLTIDPLWRPLVQAVAMGSKTVGLGEEFAPGTGPLNYLQSHKYDDNVLTSSQSGWDYMTSLVGAHPGLEIGGPSIQWLHAALTETKELAVMTSPEIEAYTLIGSEEKVVNKRDVIEYMEKWPNSQISIVTGARHEILMETPDIRRRAHILIDAFFSG